MVERHEGNRRIGAAAAEPLEAPTGVELPEAPPAPPQRPMMRAHAPKSQPRSAQSPSEAHGTSGWSWHAPLVSPSGITHSSGTQPAVRSFVQIPAVAVPVQVSPEGPSEAAVHYVVAAAPQTLTMQAPARCSSPPP